MTIRDIYDQPIAETPTSIASAAITVDTTADGEDGGREQHVEDRSVDIFNVDESDSDEDDLRCALAGGLDALNRRGPISRLAAAAAGPSSSSSSSSQSADENDDENDDARDNADPLYDARSDDRNQRWMDGVRRASYGRSVDVGSSGGASSRRPDGQQPLFHTDAVLNCPACFTTLCADCQRHELYQNQYRAMFVLNCRVDHARRVAPRPTRTRRPRRGGGNDGGDAIDGNETGDQQYRPVACAECTTEVAVMDNDEVFHFYNVIASHS